MSETIILSLSLLSSCCVVMLLGGSYGLKQLGFGGVFDFLPGGLSGATVGSQLPSPDPSKKDAGPWYVRSAANPDNARLTSEGLKISFERGKVNTASGITFHANPNKTLPATKAGISCSVYVPKDFPWTYGGKFAPGFCLGTGPYDCATGGDWQGDAGSVRVSWSQKGPSVSPYIYLPTEVGGSQEKSLQAQSSAFRSAADATDRTGLHMWREVFKVSSGKWNDIALEIELNTPGKADGTLKFTCNGVSRTLSGVKWRASEDVRINQVVFSSFFGGSSSKYAPSKDTYLVYRNFGYFAN